MKNKRVAILLATYNGQRFLREQLESILSQSYRDWHLYINDDHSSDDSVSLIHEFQTIDSRITLLDGVPQSLGAKYNFAFLMQAALDAGCDYFFLADQDDVWLSHKLAEQLSFMQKLEGEQHGQAGLPLLIHSDLQVVDESGVVIADSFMRYQGLAHESQQPLSVLLCQNFVTGCTIMGNRALLEKALPMPAQALMHDGWLALCAATWGRLEFIAGPLVQYRQHQHNVVGAKVKGIRLYLPPYSNSIAKQWQSGRVNLFNSMRQAEALLSRLDGDEKAAGQLIAHYASLHHRPVFNRVLEFLKSGVHTQTRLRQVLLLSRLLFKPADFE